MFLLFFLISTLADRTAAFVGDEIILMSEVEANVIFIANDPAAKNMFTNVDEIKEYILDQLISSNLLLVEAEKESIFVEPGDVAFQVEQTIENFKKNFPSEADFYSYLEAQNITLDELKNYYERNFRNRMIMEQLIAKKFASRVMISPVAVRRFYEENKDSIGVLPGRVRLAHILLPIRPSEDELKKGFEKAFDIYKLLLSGGDFSVIAQEFSEDISSKKRGGMLGRIRRGETLEEFEAIIFNLNPGTISQPFPTRLGYHIVEILNKGEDWVLVRQILIKITTSRADTLRYERFADELRRLINEGSDFDSLAKEHSQDPSIDLGEFYINQLTPPFDDVVEELKQGEVSEPILTPYGYHLLYIKEKIPQKMLSFEELRDQIMQYLYQQELQERYDELIEELQEKTFVKKFDLAKPGSEQ